MSVRTKSLESRFWEKVSKGTGCWEWTAGRVNGYGVFSATGTPGPRVRRAHRVSFELANGPIPEGLLVDHICHNRACVNPTHLRLATYKQNSENRAGAQRNNKTGIRGVYWDKGAQAWRAHIRHMGTGYYLGLYASLEEASHVAAAMRKKLFTYSNECGS